MVQWRRCSRVYGGERMKRGERKDGSVVKHCGIRIAAKWNYCPMCGKKKQTKVIEWEVTA